MRRSLGSTVAVVLALAGMFTVATPILAGSPFGIKDFGKVVSAVQKQGSGSKKSSGNDWQRIGNKIIDDYTSPGGGHDGWFPKPQPKPCPQPLPVPLPHPYPKPCPKPLPLPHPYPQPCPKPYPVPCPTPQPVPFPTPIVCPVPQPVPCPTPGNELPPPVCTNPLPGNGLPGTPSDGRVVTIVNPETTGGTVRFQLAGQQLQLEVGYRQAATSGGSQVIEFDRGGNYGKARYTLSEGTYHFSVGERGWDLVKKSFNVVIDNTQGQNDFRYLIGGELQTVQAGDTNRHKDSFPLVVEFDQGRGGQPAQRLLEDGTYRIGINPDTGLWDMFAAQENAPIAGNPLPTQGTTNPLPVAATINSLSMN